MADPELVMLDEPMAGVNPALKQSLLGHVKSLRDEGRTVLFVEHDMDMVRDISDWVIVMAQGKVIAEGPPDSVMGDQRVIDAYLGSHHDQDLSPEMEERDPRRGAGRDPTSEARVRTPEGDRAEHRHREPRRRAPSPSRPRRTRSTRRAQRAPGGRRGRRAARRRPDRRLPARRQHPQRRRPVLPGGRAGRHHRPQRRRQVDAAQGAVRPGEDRHRHGDAQGRGHHQPSAPTTWSPRASASSRRPTTSSRR